MRNLMACLLLTVLMLTGCWDVFPIENLGIVNMIIVDTKGPRTEVTVQETIPTNLPSGQSSSGASAGKPIVSIKGQGDDLYGAVRDADNRSGKRLYFGQLEVIIVSDETLKTTGLAHVLDYFSRSPKSRNVVWLYAVKHSDIAKITSLRPSEVPYPTLALVDMSAYSKGNSEFLPIRLFEAETDISTVGKQVVLPVISAIGDQFNIDGEAVLRGDRLAGYLSPKAIPGYPWLLGKVRWADVTVQCAKGGTAALEAVMAKRSIEPVVVHGKLQSFAVHLTTRMRLSQLSNCTLSYESAADRKTLSQEAAKQLHLNAMATITEAKHLHSDIFGFGEAVRAYYPKTWQALETDWNDKVFPALPITVDVQVAPGTSGFLLDGIRPATEPSGQARIVR